MTSHAQAFLDKAAQAIETARITAGAGDAAAAINRAYYAAFYAASAALIAEGKPPKSHRGLLNLFRTRFVRTGLISDEVGKVLHLAFDLRQQADYDAFTIFEVDAAYDLISEVEIFVEAVSSAIGK